MKNLKYLLIIILSFTFISGFKTFDERPVSEISSELLMSYVVYLSDDALEGRLPGTQGDAMAQSYISGYFQEFGLIPMGDDGTYIQNFEMSYRAPRGSTEPTISVITGNVLGMLEGSDPVLKNEVIVIGGHYDHVGWGEYGSLHRGDEKGIHNGADDNASGTAGVIEIARVFSQSPEKPKRSILFMLFAGEEAGLLGSNYFTKSKTFEDLDVVAMLNLDMIGMLRDDKFSVNGTGTSPIWEDLFNSLNESYNFNLSFSRAGMGPSDHAMFYVQEVPAVHFFTGLHDHYHRPTDTHDRLNYEGLAKVTQFVFEVAESLANAPERPAFTKSETSQQRQMGNIKVSVGVIPDYADNELGMEISGVREGSPAEKSGLKGGDVITKFAGKTVKDIYGFTDSLTTLEPGQEVECEFIRNGEKMTIKVTVEGR